MIETGHYDEGGNRLRLARLQDRGVNVWGAERVYVSEEVPLDNIESGASIYQGTLAGKNLSIGKGSRIGWAGHAHLENCRIGRDVELGAGVYQDCAILDGAKVRGFAEVRPGTALEEHCEAAHSVAFKNTILTATCVTGSVLNYCDLFMSGGTSRKDHSEVGSGVIHFNFDPRGDKWGSLIGDARGLLLRSAPVFVGGQCGLIGPLHLDFGAVVAAGSMVRRDVGPDRVHFEAVRTQTVEGFNRHVYTRLRRKFLTTARLIGNLHALIAWYEQVRLPFADERLEPLYRWVQQQARAHIAERVKRIEKIIGKLEQSIQETERRNGRSDLIAEHRRLIEREADISRLLVDGIEPPACPETFVRDYEAKIGDASHVEAVRSVSDESASVAADWVQGIAEEPARRLAELMSFE